MSLSYIFKVRNNGSQLKNPEISGAIFTLSLSILILNSMCRERQICQGSLIDHDYIINEIKMSYPNPMLIALCRAILNETRLSKVF